jgi:outer membrane autotransporter protein
MISGTSLPLAGVLPGLSAVVRRGRLAAAAVLLVLLGGMQALLVVPAAAQPVATWTGAAGDGDWFNGGNWSTGTVPNNNRVVIMPSNPVPGIDGGNAAITGSLNIGAVGQDAFLAIENGGTFTRSAGHVEIYVGSSPGGSVLAVTGPGSAITSTFTGSSIGFIRVGEIGPSAGAPGVGDLLVLSGATVSGAQIFIGDPVGSIGHVAVDGAGSSISVPAQNNNTGWVSVGFAGTGRLEISNGGTVTSQIGALATEVTGNATVIVTDAGSLWTINGSSEFHVGGRGTGVLTIENGGQVNAMTSPIAIGGTAAGPSPLAQGTVRVHGPGSSLTNTTSIAVGVNDGTGMLIVSDGGNVTTEVLHIAKGLGSSGRLSIGAQAVDPAAAPGTIDANAIQFSGGLGSITFNHTSASYFFGVPISGVGGVVQIAGTTILTADNTYGAGTLILGGTLQLGDGGTTGSIVGIVSIGKNGTLAIDRSDALTFGDAIIGSGAIRQIGFGLTNLTADSSGFTGTTSVEAGTLAVNGNLGGTMDVISGRLEGTGKVGTTTNFAGGVIAPGNSIGTLTVAGNYVGSGGLLEIEAVLAGDSSPTDLLKVTGDTSGNTNVKVNNVGGTGAPTVEGIKIVDVGGASNGAFALQGDYVFKGEQAVIGGAYAYTLHKNGVSTPTDGDWYLRSALINPPPDVPPGPLFQPGVALYESYPQILLSLMSMPTLRDRLGFDALGGRGPAPMPTAYIDEGGSYLGGPPVAGYERAPGNRDVGNPWWGRVDASRISLEPSSSTGATYDADQVRLQTGFDALIHADRAGKLLAGLTVQHGSSSARVDSVWGDGKINVEAYGLGGTLTWLGLNGFYVDTQAQVTWFDTDIRSSFAGTMADGDDAVGYGISLETGKRFAAFGPWALTPQAQLSYTSVDLDFTDAFGAEVSTRNGDSLLGRVGVALDYRNVWLGARSNMYGIANLYYEFLDGTSIDVSGTRFVSSKDELWGGLGVGGMYSWGADKYALFGEVSVNTSLDNFGDSYSVNGTAGLRVRW